MQVRTMATGVSAHQGMVEINAMKVSNQTDCKHVHIYNINEPARD